MRATGWTCLWMLLLLAGAAHAASVTVATYNVENYEAANRVTEDGFRRDYPKPESEKAALRAVLRQLGADILVLQEVGPKVYLEELQRDLATEGVSYPFALLVEADDAERHVALLSRIKPASVVPHAELEFKYFKERTKVKRGALEARFAVGGGELIIWGVHLKSRFTDRPDDPLSATRRAGEAIAIRDALLAAVPEPEKRWVLVTGDFNDAKSSRAVRLLQRRGKHVVATLLPAADSRGETWTHAYRRDDTYTRVDHMLVSAALLAFVRDGAARIGDLPEVKLASDHRPVVVTFDFPDK